MATVLTFGWGTALAQTYKCTDPTGRVTYQQRPCDGTGTALDVRPANAQVREPAPAVLANPPAPSRPVPGEAEPRTDPLDPYRLPGLRLSLGMNVQQVVSMWGLPTEMSTDRGYTIMHWCDARIALLVKGVLRAWDAPFADSRKGATLYSYGEPWIRASQRWGSDPNQLKIEPYSGPLLGRGEVRKWTPLRWIVTDQQGNISGWCDAAEHRPPVRPPAFNVPF